MNRPWVDTYTPIHPDTNTHERTYIHDARIHTHLSAHTRNIYVHNIKIYVHNIKIYVHNIKIYVHTPIPATNNLHTHTKLARTHLHTP